MVTTDPATAPKVSRSTAGTTPASEAACSGHVLTTAVGARSAAYAGRAPGRLTLAVVVPTYRRASGLAAVVEPHLASSEVDQVVVIDDGSGDETTAVCARLGERFPSKLTIVCQGNAGEAVARWRGAQRARADVLVFLDDDVVVSSDIGAAHRSHHAASSDPLVVIGAMPVILDGPRRKGGFATRLYAEEYEAHVRRYEADPSCILRSMWAGHFSVRRDVFLALPPPAVRLDYHADLVLGCQLADLGCRGVFDGSIRAVHRHRRMPDQFMEDARRRGASLAWISSHPDLVPPDVVAEVMATVRPSCRWLGRCHPAAAGGMVAALAATTDRAGRARWWRLEEGAARAARQIEMGRALAGSLRSGLAPRGLPKSPELPRSYVPARSAPDPESASMPSGVLSPAPPAPPVRGGRSAR